jgi:hypothetical protein
MTALFAYSRPNFPYRTHLSRAITKTGQTDCNPSL